VAILQEAPRRWRWRVRCAALAHDLGLVVAGGGLPSLGNLVLTSLRVRAHGVRHLQYPLTPGRHLRGAVLVECSVGSTRFTVAGSHLATDPTERPAQAARLRAALREAGSPVVLGVDVNESATESAWRTLADGLTDAGVTEGRPTFPATAPSRRLDGVFVDPRFTVRAVTVAQSEAARRASDHLPLVVDLTLPTSQN
jgi:endonuclease/exonuclease/phosphatase family metal-dependent hydrolase